MRKKQKEKEPEDNQPISYAIDEPKCQQCPLWETSASNFVRRSGVYGRGTGRSGLWIYTGQLRSADIQAGLPLCGPGGELLTNLFREIGLNEDDLFITSVLRCRTPNDAKPKVDDLRKCMEVHAGLDMPKTPPKLIVTLGNEASKILLGLQKLSSNRGTFLDCDLFECKALATFHPNKILAEPHLYHTLKSDFIRAKEFIYPTLKEPTLPPLESTPIIEMIVNEIVLLMLSVKASCLRHFRCFFVRKGPVMMRSAARGLLTDNLRTRCRNALRAGDLARRIGFDIRRDRCRDGLTRLGVILFCSMPYHIV